jgi:hypothetical protein
VRVGKRGVDEACPYIAVASPWSLNAALCLIASLSETEATVPCGPTCFARVVRVYLSVVGS